MQEQDILQIGLQLEDTYMDTPFKKDLESIVLKHKFTHKWFALIMHVQGNLYVNVKTAPMYSELLRKNYPYILPAYHMNKDKWISILLDGSVSREEIFPLIDESYNLVMPKAKKHSKN